MSTPRSIIEYFLQHADLDEPIICAWWEKGDYDIPDEVWGDVTDVVEDNADWGDINNYIGQTITEHMK